MKLKIITDRGPFVDGRKAAMDDIVEVADDAGKAMIENGFAQRIDDPKPKRARTAKGQLKADDPSTPDVNEAWEGGKAPKKRGRPKKNG